MPQRRCPRLRDAHRDRRECAAYPFGSSVRRLTRRAAALYAQAVLPLEIGLIAAIAVFFIAADLYVRGCETI